ncbi:hypothetical protein VTK56DRAFT_6125 [Thermocarpiscus australiensis]
MMLLPSVYPNDKNRKRAPERRYPKSALAVAKKPVLYKKARIPTAHDPLPKPILYKYPPSVMDRSHGHSKTDFFPEAVNHSSSSSSKSAQLLLDTYVGSVTHRGSPTLPSCAAAAGCPWLSLCSKACSSSRRAALSARRRASASLAWSPRRFCSRYSSSSPGFHPCSSLRFQIASWHLMYHSPGTYSNSYSYSVGSSRKYSSPSAVVIVSAGTGTPAVAAAARLLGAVVYQPQVQRHTQPAEKPSSASRAEPTPSRPSRPMKNGARGSCSPWSSREYRYM